ncbi:MAG: cupin domain-containing protein [Myxococcales bacterium]|nr:cupin domain-containing protein [Myxococcales bacterium]
MLTSSGMFQCHLKSLPDEPVHGADTIRKRVMLRAGQVGAITQFAQATFPPGTEVQPHVHEDMSEVYLVERGRGLLRVDSRELSIEAGSCVTVHPGERHSLQNVGEGPLVITYFGVLSK